MAVRKARCTVVEIPTSSQGGAEDAPPRDLLPWGDPYIVRLLNKHRLQAALDDSLTFVEKESAARPLRSRGVPCEAAATESCSDSPSYELDFPFSD